MLQILFQKLFIINAAMRLRFKWIYCLVIFYHASCFGEGNQVDLDKMPPSEAVTQLIAGIRAEANGGLRTIAGGHLARYICSLAEKNHLDRLDDKTIEEIEASLDSPDIVEMTFAAQSLGTIGPRAKHSLPKLKLLFEKYSALESEVGVAGQPISPIMHYAIQQIENNTGQTTSVLC